MKKVKVQHHDGTEQWAQTDEGWERGRMSDRNETICPAENVVEILDKGRAYDAGISLRFLCTTCGKHLGSPDRPHQQPEEDA